MTEQAYGTTEDQIREVKSIARRFFGKTQNYQGFSQSFKTSVEEQVNKKVLGLLQEQKPKVLVYGIYNAGKSTLVNVLCGKEVAEVGDRPTTAKTQPYDAGKYILMDTPGIDAPIEHEMEADENMNNCHVILFVVSSKGGFESRKNYERMVEMIQRGLPVNFGSVPPTVMDISSALMVSGALAILITAEPETVWLSLVAFQ